VSAPTTVATAIYDTAQALFAVGLCPLPAAEDGSKRPAVDWKSYQSTRPDEATLRELFARRPWTGLGIVCGEVSGGLEMTELEGRAVEAGALAKLREAFAATDDIALWDRLMGGYVRSPSGGLHVFTRLADAPVPGNTKLAATVDHVTLAETRGEGGWVVTAPSFGNVHSTREPWAVVVGTPATIPTITTDERERFHAYVRTLDERPVPAPEQAEVRGLTKTLDGLLNLVDDMTVIDRRGVVPDGGFWMAGDGSGRRAFADVGEYRDGVPLTERQSFAGFLQARGLVREEETGLSLRKYLRGAMFGEWSGAEAERRAMTGATAADGGFMLPAPLAAEIIDLARAETRVFQAGARLVPMANRTLDVARWAEDPTPQWRSEAAPIAEDDAALDKVTLEAHSLAVVTKITRELLEDATGIEEQLRRAFAIGFALKVDAAAMYGTGASDEPTGLINTSGIAKTNVAANGGPPTWDVLVDSVGRVRDANESPTAQVMADRTARSLGKQKDSQGTYLAAPGYLDGVRRLTTSQVPVNLTTGTSTDASDVFTGDFSQLLVGVRTALSITVLRERFMVEEGSFGLVGWYRGDVAVARPKAFDIVRGVRP
jgi:HK97 family phage major capsid protein